MKETGKLEQIGQLAMDAVKAGELARARELFDAGRKQATEIGDDRWAIRFLTSHANLDLITYRHRAAMRSYLDAMAAAEQLGDDELMAVLQFNMSVVYDLTGSSTDAAVAVDQALKSFPKGGAPRFYARILAQKAVIDARRGALHRAVQTVGRALRAADRAGDVGLQTDVLEYFGLALLLRGHTEEAAPFLVESYRLLKMNSRPVPDSCYRNLSMLYLAEGNPRLALVLMERAFDAAGKSQSPVAPWTLYYRRALIYREIGDHVSALADFESAMNSISDLRLGLLPADAVRIGSGVVLSAVYRDYVNEAMSQYLAGGSRALARRAFVAADQGRAAALRESADEFGASRERLPDEYWKTLDELKTTEQARMLGRRFDAGATALLRHRLTELEVEAGLADGGPTPSSAPVSLDLLQRRLGRREALLAFRFGPDEGYLWALTSESLDGYRIDGIGKLATKVAAFLSALASRDRAAARIGAELYTTLFGDLNANVRSKPEWVLVLDGSLFELPFAALVSGNGPHGPRYLAEEHSVRITPAASFLTAPDRECWSGPFVGIGDPIYNTADPRWRSGEPMIPFRPSGPLFLPGVRSGRSPPIELARLAGSATETETCSRLYRKPGAASVSLLGGKASLDEFYRSLKWRPEVIHFATHVIGAPGSRKSGYIALSLGASGRMDLLGPTEIAALEVKSKLVTLSGCASGAGDVLPGEGLFGLTRAWLRAGVANVLVTHSPTLDTSGELLDEFYRRLRSPGGGGNTLPAHEALRQAQIKMLHSGTWRAQPGYWSGYFLVSRN